jgi:hypothetical protein
MGRGTSRLWKLAVLIMAGVFSVTAQSTLVEYPTPITGSEIRGEIRPRAIGDSRATTYYYAFNGAQGDVFINVVTRNFDGDIDVFLENGLRPLTKIVMFADAEQAETGRVIYLRRPERLILRVQGRTPNDDPANYQIKFAGSFVALKEGEIPEPPEMPTVAQREPVRSVPPVSEIQPVEERVEQPTPQDESPPVQRAETDTARTPSKAEPAGRTERAERTASPPRTERADSRRSEPQPPRDPMANFSLVIRFKDGTTLVRPMTEVSRFSVDRGVLTIVGKDGRPRRYQMTDIVRVAIE